MFKRNLVWVSAFFILLAGSTGFAEESSDPFRERTSSQEASSSDPHWVQLNGFGDSLIGAFLHFDNNDDRSRHRRRRHDRRRGSSRSCSAEDRGWEEHYGGHQSCQSCLRKHGSCIETCEKKTYECKVKGFNYDDDWERTFKGKARRRQKAKNKAIDRCYDAGYDSCYSQGCDSSYSTVRSEC